MAKKVKNGFKPGILIFFYLIITLIGNAQNVMVGINAKNGGIVKVGDEIRVEISVHNTSSIYGFVLPYRLKPQFNIDSNYLKFVEKGHQLPGGWSIVSENASDLRLSNGKDSIPPNERRTFTLLLKAVQQTTSSKVLANLFFSNGKPPGNYPGPSLQGDLSADNSSLVVIEIRKN